MPHDLAIEPHCATALVYETTEEARVLLDSAAELDGASRAAGEAAYYLSDTIEPDEREILLALAETRPLPCDGTRGADERAAEALLLLADAADEVEQMLRGPNASSELRIAQRALRRGIAMLARRPGIDADHDGALAHDPRRRGVLPRLRPGH
jgi:hypothetical protein